MDSSKRLNGSKQARVEQPSWVRDQPMFADDPFRIATLMTFTTWLLSTPIASHWALDFFMIAGIIHPTLYRQRTYWFLFALVFLVSPWTRPWLELDNHHWLEAYWVVAIALSRWSRSPDRTLKDTARILVGLAFFFATLWKLISPDFMSGEFFEFTFWVDGRLTAVAVALGLQESGIGAPARAALDAWQTLATTPEAAGIMTSDAIHWLAPILAWLTVLIEGAVAVVFLCPLRSSLHWLRDGMLLTFVVATYPLAPVLSFGKLLLAMGIMQSELEDQIRNHLYVATFIALALLQYRGVMLRTISELLA